MGGTAGAAEVALAAAARAVRQAESGQEGPAPPKLFLWRQAEVLAALAEDHDGLGAAGRAIPGVMFRGAPPQSAEDPRSPPVWQVLLRTGGGGSGLVDLGKRLVVEARLQAQREAAASAAGVPVESIPMPTSDGVGGWVATDSEHPGAASAGDLPGHVDAGAGSADRLAAREDEDGAPGNAGAAASSGNVPFSRVVSPASGRPETGAEAKPGDAHLALGDIASGLLTRMRAKRWREAALTLRQPAAASAAVDAGLTLVPGSGAVSAAICIRCRLYSRADWTLAMQRRKEATEAVAKAKAARTAALAATMAGGRMLVHRVVDALLAERQQASNVAASRIALLRRRAADAEAMDKERIRLCRSREFAVQRLKRRRARLRLNVELAEKTVEEAESAGLPELPQRRAEASAARAAVREVSREIRGGRWEQPELRRLHTDFVVTRDASAVTDFRMKEELQGAAEVLMAVITGVSTDTNLGEADERLRKDPLPQFASGDSGSLWVWRARLRREAEAWGAMLGRANFALPPHDVEVAGLREEAMKQAADAAVAETHRSYGLLRKTAASWRALGIKSMLWQWRVWATNHKDEVAAKRKQRRLERRRVRNEAIAREKLRELERAKWVRKWDKFNEEWFWEHSETGETRKHVPKDLVFRDGKRIEDDPAEAEAQAGAAGRGQEAGTAASPAAAAASGAGAGAEEGRVKVGPKQGPLPQAPWLAQGIELARLDGMQGALEQEWEGVSLANEHTLKLGL
jgi:hypothetical protein